VCGFLSGFVGRMVCLGHYASQKVYPDVQIIQLASLLLSAFGIYFIYRQLVIKRGRKMQIFKRDNKSISENEGNSLNQQNDLISSVEENQSRADVSVVTVAGVTRKNTFIA
jgi:uncharacterized membrane protein